MVKAAEKVFDMNSKAYLQPQMTKRKMTQVVFPSLNAALWDMGSFAAVQAPNFRTNGLGFGLIMGKVYYVGVGNGNGVRICDVPEDFVLDVSSAYACATSHKPSGATYAINVKVEQSGIYIVDGNGNFNQGDFVTLDSIVVPLK